MDTIITNDTALEASPKGSMTLFDINFSMAIVYVTLVLILSILGLFGNLFVIYVMKKEKHMNKDARAFIINLAVADLCVSGIADPMCIAEQIYKNNHNCSCIATWVLSFGAELPNFFGLGGHYFDEKSHQCIWDRTANRGYTLFVTLGLITSPFFLLAYCNTAVLMKIRNVRKNVLKFSTGTNSTLKSSISSAKILITIFMVFIVCWTPYVIVLVLDANDTFSLEVHLFATLLAHSHSSTSCIIYLCFKKKFREILVGLFRARNRVQPIVSSSGNQVKTATDKTVSTNA
ncbi:melanopsin-like [Ruditapes philippinarum]|uniref:melanopsin-like n=1 Tax=Ruditapes philippinarum TaxID=129788 RepID=UPI00295B7270|nr:melanopsin-like [Ruditapes philippinarum]